MAETTTGNVCIVDHWSSMSFYPETKKNRCKHLTHMYVLLCQLSIRDVIVA